MQTDPEADTETTPAAVHPKPLGELDLIRLIQTRTARLGSGRSKGVVLGIGDDCAILRPRPSEDLVVTTDFSLEGRHFRRDWHTPEVIGHRLLARGLSDLAAMGARPVAAFLSLALPRAVAAKRPWLEAMLDGFTSLARRTGTPLAGGDTAEAPADQVLADIVLLGAVPRGRALRRDGAQPGDRLFVTGTLGGAAAQLETLLARQPRRPSRPGKDPQPHFFPEPRLAAGQALLRRAVATAALDLSDGLSTDLLHLCEQSNVAAEVHTAKLPFSPLLSRKSAPEALRLALHGGEDYELLFTVPPGRRPGSTVGKVPVTEIGRIVSRRRGQPRVTLVDSNGQRQALEPQGWEHLR